MENSREMRKVLVGVVTSDKMNKTIVVKVTSKRAHLQYTKLLKHSKKFKVHDEKEIANVGDTVKIMQTRPISKEKKWRLVEILNIKTHKE